MERRKIRKQALLLVALALSLPSAPAASQAPANGPARFGDHRPVERHPTPPTSARQSQGRGQTVQIEQRSPGAFGESARTALAESSVRYRINATVLIPLLVTAIPLVSRDDVGVGSFTVRDFDDGADGPLRAYEFFAASIPERARGLNRLGFIREAVKLGDPGAAWTAQFGVISADRADTREEAERSFDQNQNLQPYAIIDAMIEPRSSWSSVVTLPLEGSWESAGALFGAVRPLWATASLEQRRELRNLDGTLYDEPVGFLGAIQGSLRRVARSLSEGEEPARFRYAYVHNSRALELEFRGRETDRSRAADYAEAGLIAAGTIVHHLEYRVYDENGDDIESFDLWTELPTAPAESPAAIMPLSFELLPRSYLRLTAVQAQR